MFAVTARGGHLLHSGELAAEEFEHHRTVVGSHDVLFQGTILNGDVVQMLTPASMRAEHPIATALSCVGLEAPGFQTLQKLAGYLSQADGAFFWAVRTKSRTHLLLGVRNIPYRLTRVDEHTLLMAKTTGPISEVYLVAATDDTIDFVDLEIPVASGRKLWIVEKLTDPWAAASELAKGDVRVTYTQLGYMFRNGPRTPVDAAQLICRVASFYFEMDRPDITAAAVGLGPTNIDLLTASTLSRLLFVITDRRLRLELPLYASLLGTKTLRAN